VHYCNAKYTELSPSGSALHGIGLHHKMKFSALLLADLCNKYYGCLSSVIRVYYDKTDEAKITHFRRKVAQCFVILIGKFYHETRSGSSTARG